MWGFAVIIGVYIVLLVAQRRAEAAPPPGQAQFDRFMDMLAHIRHLFATRNRA